MSDIRELDALRRELNALKVREKAGRALPFSVNGALLSPFAAAGAPFVAPIGRSRTPLRLECAVQVVAPNSAASYWTITLNLLTPADAVTAQGSVTTSGIAAGGWQVLALTTFTTALWDASLYSVAYLAIAKAGATGTPGNLYLAPALWVV